ncbi:hypothetical protein Tco_1228981 [Tanacetum coccineum]
MVAYLKKPTGSEGFQEIVDFLNDSYIRRHLQLADVDDISVLPTTEIFDQLSLMGEHTLLFPSMLVIQAEEGEGSGHPSEPQPPPSTAQPTHEEPIPNIVSSSHQKIQTSRQALNEVIELPQTSGSPRCQEAMGGSIAQTSSERVPTLPCDSPLLRVHTLRSDEGSMILQELTVLCTTLSKKMESLEADLKQTKQIYDAAYTKLIMKGEDQPEDQLGVLNAAKVLADAAKTYTKRRRAVSTGSGRISTAKELVSTAGASMPVSTAEQERLGHEAAVRLQEELDEEERQRMVRVHEAAQYFTREEWENIRARVEADEELSQRLQAEERNKYNEVDQAKMLIDLINQRKKYFATQKAEAKRNKPMTQAQ